MHREETEAGTPSSKYSAHQDDGGRRLHTVKKRRPAHRPLNILLTRMTEAGGCTP